MLISNVANSNQGNSLKVLSLSILDNPPSKLHHVLPYRTFDWSSEPRLILEIESPTDIKKSVFRLSYSEKHIEITSPLRSGTNFVTFDGHFDPKQLPTSIEVTADNQSLALKLPKPTENLLLKGTVSDMNGGPVAGAWIVVLDPVFYNIGITNTNGYYEMKLPKGRYDSIAAFDKRYPTERLEDYYWNLELDKNKLLDFQIGNAEIFRLTAGALRQNKILSGTFIAYTSEKIREFLERDKPTDMNHPGFISSQNTPDLNSKNLEISLNGCLLPGPLILERTDILNPGNQVSQKLGYKFEISYASCGTKQNDNEIEVRLNSETATGRARLGGLIFL